MQYVQNSLLSFYLLVFDFHYTHLQPHQIPDGKTESGIRKVPIADKVLPFYKDWYNSCPDCEYLLHTEAEKHFKLCNYYCSHFSAIDGTVKDFIAADIPAYPYQPRQALTRRLSKRLWGHSGAMTLTEKMYTHFDIKELVDAINKI